MNIQIYLHRNWITDRILPMRADKNQPMSASMPGNKVDHLAWILMTIPFVVYFMVFNHYIVDVPVWDDYVNPLDITNQAILAPTLKEKLLLLATPMNGHIPFLPRSLLYLQYLAGITASIKTALIISNAGWMAATLIILIYCHRSLNIAPMLLVPVPYLLLSIIHWEAMDFYSSAMQMYWGSGLLAIVGLIAITTRHPIVASLCFLAGILASGGTLAAYPISLLYLCVTRRWKDGVIFLTCTVAVLWGYVHLNPPQQNIHAFPNPLQLSLYTLEFTGNILSNGLWDMTSYAWIHRTIGTGMILLMLYLFKKTPGCHLFKLLFLYVVALGVMCGYMRMDVYSHAVSRYSMYALLAAVCVYVMLVSHVQSRNSMLVPTVSLAIVVLWMHGLYVCRSPLQTNHSQRIAEMQRYIETGDPKVLESWNAVHAQRVLDMSRQTGLYDYTRALSH
jgi:hypothetical protein